MSAPVIHPAQRNLVDIAPTESYRPADPVWVYRAGAWRAGVVEVASARAATVTYRTGASRGTAVDTMTAECVFARDDLDPALDHR
ncbi:MAG: hypothetical protein E6F99_20930 [Actinobacteria bacterium]|nr:MAG: hypothetical protein E6F99_20930 [Actinomycetota bacterium]